MCVRICVRAYMRACVCMRACACMCVCVCVKGAGGLLNNETKGSLMDMELFSRVVTLCRAKNKKHHRGPLTHMPTAGPQRGDLFVCVV